MAIDPNQSIVEKFVQSRKKLSVEKNRALERAGDEHDRFKAVSGLKGGSVGKAKEKIDSNILEQFGGAEAALGAAEAGAKVAREERIAGQEFIAGESKLGREQQERQFQQSLKLQDKALAASIEQFWSEFAENKKTNFINAAIAAKESDVHGMNSTDFSRILGRVNDFRAQA